jgi:uncharacterized protein (DUF2141 family)
MKHTLTLIIAALVFTLTTSFKAPSAGSVQVQITGLRSSKGAVLISIFNNAKDFPENANGAVGKTKVSIVNGVVTHTFSDMPYGTYAIALLHDENNNLKMDFNIVGMPKEGYGFSNDAKVRLGPPSFEDAAFKLDATNKVIRIKCSYFLK